jgi:outer membrane protein OmpA-like peptidoglycan-associated protein
MKKNSMLVLATFAGLFACQVQAVSYVKSPPLTEVVKTQVGAVQEGGIPELRIITWGGDIATIYANGNQVNTASGSLFDKEGLKWKIVREDNFPKQVEGYLSGKTPYLRGTLGQINMALELLSKDPRTKPVAVYNLTRSIGGDCLGVKAGINTIQDLKGKTIALQAYGPHVEFLGTVLDSAGLKVSDVNIKWVKDLTGSKETPGQALIDDPSVDAAFVISTDANALTSGGKVGDGSEGSVKGARILFSTKTARNVIFDMYVVRSDYFASYQNEVAKFVHALLLAEENLSQLMANPTTQKVDYEKTMAAAGKIILDSEQAKNDVLGLYGDCEYVGYPGNIKFLATPTELRRLETVTGDIQDAFIGLGLMSAKMELVKAGFDYEALKKGLTKTAVVEVPRFQESEVAKVIDQKMKQGNDGSIFSFEILFSPNQNTFNADLYKVDFDKAIDLAATYGGAILTVEGHSDPTQYIDKKASSAQEVVLTRLRQSAKNLSLTRAIAVRESLLGYGKSKSVIMDPTQFAVVGHGFEQPKTGLANGVPIRPKNEQEWASNMRVVFKLIPVGDAEAQVFTPAGGGK